MDEERLRYSDFLEHSVVDSLIIPGLKVEGPTTFVCPRCHNRMDAESIEHDKPFECNICLLQMVVYGNLLTIRSTYLLPE